MYRASSLILIFLFTRILCIAEPVYTPAYDQSDSVGSVGSVMATDDSSVVFLFTLAEDIMQPAWRTVKRALEEAHNLKADYIIMKLDTYGGLVNVADSIRTKLLNADAVTMVYIMNNAASAGALISIACDSIYMATGAKIGAATVVSGSGEAMPDKYQSYMRATMRSTAEAKGRNPEIAEAMVDPRKVVPGVIDSGEVLTFTTAEAIENGFCEAELNSVDEVLQRNGLSNAEIKEFKPTAVDGIIKFLTNPIVGGILMMVIFFGIYMELQSPGVGFPLLAAAIASGLYFAPLYLDGLAANWEIVLFVAGIILLALEIFVIPGFGIAGILGIGFMVGGLVLSMVGNVGFDFRFTGTGEFVTALFSVLAALSASFVLIMIVMRKLGSTPLLKHLVLNEAQQSQQGWTTDSYGKDNQLEGVTAEAASDLRPAGKVEIGNKRYDAATEGEYIQKGTRVRVLKVMGNYLLVARPEE